MNKKKNILNFVVQVVLDVLSVFFSYWLGFVFRFLPDRGIPDYYVDSFRGCIPWITLICVAVFALFRFYSTMWEVAGFDELLQIFYGTTTACLLVTIAGFTVFPRLSAGSGVDFLRFPVPIYVMGWVLMLFFIGGTRFAVRFLRNMKRRQSAGSLTRGKAKRVMIVGAGEMGSMAIKEMKNAPQSLGIPVAAIDDDRKKRGTRIHGVKIVGGRGSIPQMAARYRVDEILLAIPTAKQEDKRRVIDICSGTGCRLKTIPALYEMMEDGALPLKTRDVDILDLLGRDEIKLDTKEISGYLQDKTIIVTGGGGTIGSELCRQIAPFHPKKLVILEIYENNAYLLQREMKQRFPSLDLEIVIGSVRDRARLKHIFSCYQPDVVFHAAAHKHVPLMEFSPGEAVKNNVFGTLNVAQMCDKFHAKHMVLISTDKAVNPTSVMGATKRICELIIQYYGRHSQTDFAAVRFGNVLGSSGSVIPIFRQQIEEGGPVTVTHPDIVRYFMTIPEAARLVIQAGGMASGGEIFVLDMGEPVKIVDLAKNLIRLSGYEPGAEIKIEFTGLRPGEKLYEEPLLRCEGKCRQTSHSLIFVGSPIQFDEAAFLENIEALRKVAGVDNPKMMEIIHRLIPSYTGHAEESDLLALQEKTEDSQKAESRSLFNPSFS